MPRDVGREELVRLLDGGAQLVEVLPKEEYDEEHLPGAINIPLRRIDEEARERLDPQRPVVVSFRPFVPIVEMAQYMIEHDLAGAPITTGDGVLVGMLRREDAAKAALEWQERHREEDHEHG